MLIVYIHLQAVFYHCFILQFVKMHSDLFFARIPAVSGTFCLYLLIDFLTLELGLKFKFRFVSFGVVN